MAFYNCLLFDIDGTLLDFHASEETAIREALAHYAFTDIEAAVLAYRSINQSLWAALEKGEIRQEKLVVQRFEKLLSQFSMQGDAVQMNDYYLTKLSARADVFDGAEDALRDLAEVATLAVVSNGIERVQTNRLVQSGLDKYFDAVFISSKVGAAKPARKIFDVALNTLGIEKRDKVLVVGDSLKADIAGGKNAGLATCWCNFEDAAMPEDAAKPNHTIHGYEELMRIVMEEEELSSVGSSEKRHQV
ncbi:MAG: YjjG family noncanonical pyrimidine nucleotidase [Ruthenibacterium sp.]